MPSANITGPQAGGKTAEFEVPQAVLRSVASVIVIIIAIAMPTTVPVGYCVKQAPTPARKAANISLAELSMFLVSAKCSGGFGASNA
jgi:hypothetical protein